jgi:hypothetical protein
LNDDDDNSTNIGTEEDKDKSEIVDEGVGDIAEDSTMLESINKPRFSMALVVSGNVWLEVDHDSSEVRDREKSVKAGVEADTGTTRDTGSVMKGSADVWLVDDNSSSVEVDAEESVGNNAADIESVVNISANAWIVDKGGSAEVDVRKAAEDAAINIESIL